MICKSDCFFELLYIPDLDGPIVGARSEVGLVGVDCQCLDGVGVSLMYQFDRVDLVDH